MTIEPTGNAPDAREGLFDLAPPFWGKPRIAAWLVAMLDRVQEIENAVDDVIRLHQIGEADLTRLQRLARIVAEPYLGQALETFRALVRSRILANRSDGRTETILRIFSLLWPDGDYAVEESSGALCVWLLSPTTPDPDLSDGAKRQGKLASPAGRSFNLVVSDADPLTLSGPVVSLSTLTYSGSGATAYSLAWEVTHG